jgi:hypothetical protein
VAFRRGPDGKPAVPGQSRVGNYGPMTTFHHRVKTFGRWQVRQPFPGIFVWRDEHGAFYLVDHTGSRRINGPKQPGCARSDPPEVAESGPVELEIHTPDVRLVWAA